MWTTGVLLVLTHCHLVHLEKNWWVLPQEHLGSKQPSRTNPMPLDEWEKSGWMAPFQGWTVYFQVKNHNGSWRNSSCVWMIHNLDGYARSAFLWVGRVSNRANPWNASVQWPPTSDCAICRDDPSMKKNLAPNTGDSVKKSSGWSRSAATVWLS